MFAHQARRTRVALQACMLLLAVVVASPLAVALLVSLRGEGIGNYLAVLSHPLLPRFFLNSVVVAAATIALVYVIAGTAAFALAKLRLRGRQVIFLFLLTGLMIPPVALIVPLFIAFRAIGLFGNPLAVIIPEAALVTPLAVVLMRGYLVGLPDELLEAAQLDGCSSFGLLVRIVRPLARQIATVVAIYTFLTSWNEFFLPLAFMQRDADRMVTQAPLYFMNQFGQDTGKVFAALILISLPVIAAYLASRRVFESGLTAGAVKQ